MATGQMKPLKARLNPAQQVKRIEKMMARRTAHEQLDLRQRQFMAGIAGALNGVFGRSFLGKMKWLFLGR